MEVLMRRGPASRADLTRYTGISAPTISKAVASLSDAGLIEEQQLYLNKTGRPGHLYSLASHTVVVLGVAIEPQYTYVTCTGMDAKPREDRTRRFETPDDYEQLLDQIATVAKRLMNVSPDARTLGMGVCVPGHLDSQIGVPLDCPGLPWLQNKPLAADLKKRLDLDSVIAVKQAQAMCLAERWSDAARQIDFFCFLDLTSDVTVAMIKGSHLLRGQHGVSGALGQLPVPDAELRNGSTPRFKDLATDVALVKAVNKRTGKKMRIDQITAARQSGQLKIDDLVDRTLNFMAIGLAAVVNLFDPEAVFVHSRLFEADPELFNRLIKMACDESLMHSRTECQVYQSTMPLINAPVAAFVYRLTESLGPRFD